MNDQTTNQNKHAYILNTEEIIKSSIAFMHNNNG